MKIFPYIVMLSVAAPVIGISAAFGTEPIIRNVSYDDCTVSRHLNSTFAKFFEDSENIFEGTVTAIGPIPNRTSFAANECWVNFHVNKWHKTSIASDEVNVMINSDPNSETLGKDNKIHCPVEQGKSYLLFADQYKKDSGTGNEKFYLNNCSLYLPASEARFFIRLLNVWNNAQR